MSKSKKKTKPTPTIRNIAVGQVWRRRGDNSYHEILEIDNREGKAVIANVKTAIGRSISYSTLLRSYETMFLESQEQKHTTEEFRTYLANAPVDLRAVVIGQLTGYGETLQERNKLAFRILKAISKQIPDVLPNWKAY